MVKLKRKLTKSFVEQKQLLSVWNRFSITLLMMKVEII